MTTRGSFTCRTTAGTGVPEKTGLCDSIPLPMGHLDDSERPGQTGVIAMPAKSRRCRTPDENLYRRSRAQTETNAIEKEWVGLGGHHASRWR